MRETGKMRTEGADGEFLAVHPDVVERVLEKQPQDEYLYDLAELFKVFGDTTRIKILYALFESELCVGDIASILSLSQSAISHQLRILKDSKLVKFRRDGKIIFYSLDDEHVRNILAMRQLCGKDGGSGSADGRCKGRDTELYDSEAQGGV